VAAQPAAEVKQCRADGNTGAAAAGARTMWGNAYRPNSFPVWCSASEAKKALAPPESRV
jgi:hypothetical protein